MESRVVGISIAPVKAMALVCPDEVVVGAIGVVGNRRFWLRDENGNLFNAKKEGRLLQIRPQWDESSRRLALTFPDGRRVEGLVQLGEQVDAFVYGELRPSRRVSGAAWGEAVSEFVGRPLELLWADDNAVDRLTSEGTVSLISTASLDRLREEMGVDRPVDWRRFRMLFQIDGSARTKKTHGSGGMCRSARQSSSSRGTSVVASSPRATLIRGSATCRRWLRSLHTVARGTASSCRSA